MTYQIHSRRKIAAGLGAAMLPSQFVAFAQAQPQNTLLKRPIAHGGGETLPVIGLGTAVLFNIGQTPRSAQVQPQLSAPSSGAAPR